MKNMKALMSIELWKRILACIIIGLLIGVISPEVTKAILPLGEIFLRMLKMLIVPLVFFSITSGICKMGDVNQLRIVGARYILWIIVSAIIAAFIGVIAALITQPGKGMTEFLAVAEQANIASYNFIDNVVSWFPTNIIEACANANMLQIIIFCLFLGIALLALGEKVAGLVLIIDQSSDTMLKTTEFVMNISPLGIMSLMATMVSTVSRAMMREILLFLVVDIVCCLILLLIIYPLTIKLLCNISSIKFMKKITPAILVAISTTSSAATLPISIKLSGEDLGIPENIYGFILPLGNTCGMTGFALFIGMCCVFASNLYGLPVTFSSILQFIFLGMILSIGAAGVKGAGVVMSSVLLSALGMPLTLIPILAAIWPVIDPGHTVLNNVGDLVGTTIIAKRLNLMDMDIFEK